MYDIYNLKNILGALVDHVIAVVMYVCMIYIYTYIYLIIIMIYIYIHISLYIYIYIHIYTYIYIYIYTYIHIYIYRYIHMLMNSIITPSHIWARDMDPGPKSCRARPGSRAGSFWAVGPGPGPIHARV